MPHTYSTRANLPRQRVLTAAWGVAQDGGLSCEAPYGRQACLQRRPWCLQCRGVYAPPHAVSRQALTAEERREAGGLGQWSVGGPSAVCVPRRTGVAHGEGVTWGPWSPGSLLCDPSAESSDLFWHGQMRFLLTTIIGIDTHCEFVSAQQAVRLRHGALAMHPFRFDGVEPRTFTGQLTDHDADTHGALLHLPIVLANPVPHGVTAMPGGIIPDQQQRGEALRGELGRAPGQKIDGHRTHGAPCDKPQPHLVGLLWLRPYQQPITGQRFGVGSVCRPAQLLQLILRVCLCPGMLVGLGQPAPPDFVTKAQRPCRLGHGPLDHVVAPFFSPA